MLVILFVSSFYLAYCLAGWEQQSGLLFWELWFWFARVNSVVFISLWPFHTSAILDMKTDFTFCFLMPPVGLQRASKWGHKRKC